jgi:hypothetical protein
MSNSQADISKHTSLIRTNCVNIKKKSKLEEAEHWIPYFLLHISYTIYDI